MTAFCVYLQILGSFPEHLFYRIYPGDCLFHAQVAGFQPAYTIKTISQILLKNLIQERKVAKQRCSFNPNPSKFYMKKLIRSAVVRCQFTSLQKKTLSHILLHVLSFHFLIFFRSGLDTLFQKI